MGKLGTALLAAGVLGGVGAAVLLLGDKPALEQVSLTAREARPVVMPWSCPNEPVSPVRVACWTESDDRRELATYHDWPDCVDNTRVGECLTYGPKKGKVTSFECPMCIRNCTSSLYAAYLGELAAYDDKRSKCPLGWTQLRAEYCLCLSDRAEPAPIGLEPRDVQDAQKWRHWYCPEDGSVWQQGPTAPNRDCRLIQGPDHELPECRTTSLVGPMGYASNVDVGHVACLAKLCEPCQVSVGSWGHCPSCWFHGNCVIKCKPTDIGSIQ